MSDETATTINGECIICGLPGTVGLHCSDQDCHGTVERIDDGKAKPQEENERYDQGLVDDDTETLSLEEAAEAEERDELSDDDM